MGGFGGGLGDLGLLYFYGFVKMGSNIRERGNMNFFCFSPVGLD